MTQYQSLYRKWRPKSFEDVVGQKHVTQTLKNAIKLNRIAHSYLFTGPRGVGKTTVARILAKAVNCQDGPTEKPCSQCTCCARIDQGQSMDVLEIDGASNRGIDEIRELKSKIGFAPTEGKYKIYIIDEVHMLTNEAFNALLKTLEEPPRQVIFIFATTAPHKVPKTILSRCQVFNFRRITVGEIVEKLKNISEDERIEIDVPSLRLIAESATGSMRDAERTLEQVIAYGENKITPEIVRDALGIIPHELFRQFIIAITDKDTRAGLDLIGRLVEEGLELTKFVEDLLIYTHNLSLLKILGKDKTSILSYFEEAEWKEVEVLTKKSNIAAILKVIEELRVLAERIKYHHYPSILLELMVVRLTYSGGETLPAASAPKNTFPNKVLETKKIEAKEHMIKEEKGKIEQTASIEGQEKKEGVREKEFSTEKAPQKSNDLEELWPKVLARIKEKKISLHTFLMFGKNIRIVGDELTIDFSKNHLFPKESLDKKENKKIIESLLKEEFSCAIRLKCVISDSDTEEAPVLELNQNEDRTKDNHMSTATAESDKAVKRISVNRINSKEDADRNSILEKARDLFGGEFSEE